MTTRRLAPPVFILLLVAALYKLTWDSVESFVLAIDHHPQLFQDFLGYYYPMARTISGATEPLYGYYYSAFFAILLTPLGALEPPAALRVWGVLQSGLLVALFILPLRRLLPLRPVWLAVYTGVFATSFPLLHNTKWGQVSVLLAVCALGAFHAYKAGRPVLAGFLLALSAAIKYYPAVFILYFLFKRDLRVCLSWLFSGITLYVCIPVVVMSPEHWLNFEAATLRELARADWVASAGNSQYFSHVIGRWVTGEAGALQGESLGLLSWLSGGIFLSNMVLLGVMQRWKLRNECLLSLTLVFLSLPFAIKTSWPHYFSYLPLCQFALLTQSLSGSQTRPVWKEPTAWLPLLSMLCSSFFLFRVFPNWDAYTSAGLLFLANLLLLLSLYLLLLRRPREHSATNHVAS
jgi:alpha-1,2-mannosyltransferase